MNNRLLLGFWRLVVSLPRPLWQALPDRMAAETRAGLAFMSEDHHRIRDFAVRELPRVGEALPPELIGRQLDLPLDRVMEILDELEERMTFLYRGDGQSVTWAYPVTVDRTPHRVTFSSGEQIYAA
jgi:hypothetical protein